MKLYTKTGDTGTTGLYGGERTDKDSLRIHALGALDELNSAIGVARASLPEESDIDGWLHSIQGDLLDLGAEIGTPPDRLDSPLGQHVPLISEEKILHLEELIDFSDDQLPVLKTFILPGGALASASLHLARSTCRRAEREMVTLSRLEPIRPEASAYVNRLSDLLFVVARLANFQQGRADTLWHSN